MRKALANTPLLKPGLISEKTLEKICGASRICYGTKKCNCPKHSKYSKHPKNCRCEQCKLPIRGCLPWETQEYKKCLEKKVVENVKECESCKSPELVQKLTLSVCELRRLERCMKSIQNPVRCINKLDLVESKKIYPMIHALNKDYIPGCPIHGWQRLYTNDKCSK